MKRFTPYLIGAFAGAVLLAVFTLGQVSASPMPATACFPDTNGHWAEVFICWLKDNGVTGGYVDGTYRPENGVTRAEMSVFLQKIFNLSDSAAQTKANVAETNAKNYAASLVNVPPSIGDAYFNVGPNDWRVNGATSGAYVSYFTVQSHLQASTTGYKTFQITPTLPSSLYNTTMYFKGVLFCYKTEGVIIDEIQILHFKYYGNTGTFETLASITDLTDRVGYACRRYEFPTPVSYYPDNVLNLNVDVYFPNTSSYLSVFSTVFILSPSIYPAGYIYGPEEAEAMQPASPDVVPDYGPETGIK